ncbi:MAG: response regulator, partial [Magnetococcales bacterium]|nr:response regulator [Magnetococcales bacterium]
MKLKTLIIDDHPASIAILEEMLSDHCECSVATSGRRGIEIFEQAQKDAEPFDVVLLDIIMPGLDGIETLKRLRKIEHASHTPQLFGQHHFARIVMQTSSDDPKD